MVHIKHCKKCLCELNITTWVKVREGVIRGICKKCRSRNVMEYQKKDIHKRRSYINAYKRRKGIIKEYKCEICEKLCFKVYSKAFCSIKCRFLFYINKKIAGCWLWTGAKAKAGYGKFGIGRKVYIASRFSYELFKGPIEEGKFICHSCDVPMCVNPDHLWQGTNSENQIDSIKKLRHRHYKKLKEITNGI